MVVCLVGKKSLSSARKHTQRERMGDTDAFYTYMRAHTETQISDNTVKPNLSYCSEAVCFYSLQNYLIHSQMPGVVLM